MNIDDLLLELKDTKPKYDIEHYGNYVVTMSKSPVKVPSITGDKEMFVAKVQHKKNKNNVQLAAGNSQGEAREAAFAKIHTIDRPEDPDAFKSFTVDLNAPFSREYFDPRTGGYFKMEKMGNVPVLVMASKQYFAAFGKDMESLGFRKAAIGRTKPTASSDAAELYNFPISKNQIKALGLIPNMRYSLEEIEQDSDSNRVFKMIADTRTAGKHDKYRMPGPGLTVAATMKEGSLEEGVVSRRGNKLQVGSLELQLYPDHIFYVVGGGKDADLSIYKDGAFKTSRSNEIYLKDAADHGVPQAFINLFAKFFATQDIDIVVNGLEALFTKHVKESTMTLEELEEGYSEYSGKHHSLLPFGDKHTDPLQGKRGQDRTLKQYTRDFTPFYAKRKLSKDLGDLKSNIKANLGKHKKPNLPEEDIDEALLSPRVHEIFLKGLIGAIMAGGLSLGINYAKEKTAEYDRQGLQSIYKSIDPREYPQLTKKLTPRDRQGLNAILGKLKEHAMRMEDLISEEEKRMSRAGKGVMKYGKDGMKALAKAGRDGAGEEKLDKLRDKYNKYDEGTEPDHEASMARGQLMSACKNSMALIQMIQEGDNLDGWVAAKITKAADYLSSVHDYMAYEEVNEEKQRLDPKCWKGYRKAGTKMKGGVRVNNCVKVKK